MDENMNPTAAPMGENPVEEQKKDNPEEGQAGEGSTSPEAPVSENPQM